eukprot:gb/GECG01005381.1/.p1 GENE.gb/GECG01005381.1/~~gb/GECG01005381.1/.p1  ORF type:complete len:105 (+),score=14.29 gb/GECG01005381.1/:1-315(+)
MADALINEVQDARANRIYADVKGQVSAFSHHGLGLHPPSLPISASPPQPGARKAFCDAFECLSSSFDNVMVRADVQRKSSRHFWSRTLAWYVDSLSSWLRNAAT